MKGTLPTLEVKHKLGVCLPNHDPDRALPHFHVMVKDVLPETRIVGSNFCSLLAMALRLGAKPNQQWIKKGSNKEEIKMMLY